MFSRRIKHAPNRGYHFVSPSPSPFFQGEWALFQYLCFGKSYYFYRITCMNPPFPPAGNGVLSEECQKPQPPLLLKKVLQYTSNLYCNKPPICIAVLSVLLSSQEREILQYSSHLYRNTPPNCIATLLGKSWWFWSIFVVVVTRMFPILFQ